MRRDTFADSFGQRAERSLLGSTEALAIGFFIAFWIAAIAAVLVWHTRRDRRGGRPRQPDDER
jgi:hypothetical protein